MSQKTINFTLSGTNRKQIRDELIKSFIKEKPGTGTGDDASKYLYIVESFESYKIMLERPAQNNKGIDFVIKVDGIQFKHEVKGTQRQYTRYNNAPSHDNIYEAFKYCKKKYCNKYTTYIKDEINKIYQCKNVNYRARSGVLFKDCNGAQHPIEILLLVLKWLFIEQDCTYWNYSGRNKFYSGLQDKNLV